MTRKLLLTYCLAIISLISSCQITNRGFKSHRNKIGKASLNFTLDKTLEESSALCFWKDLFWTLNDSGGEPCMYGFDIQKGTLLHTIRIENVKNIDWEALSQDDNFFYIGDFGNNYGNRSDLRIVKIKKPELLDKKLIVTKGEIIEFSYPDQKKFESRKHTNQWDCESVVYHNDSLYIITKNWINSYSSIYAIPSVPGKYIASKKLTFNAEGLVTDAFLSADAKTLYLIGYRDYVPYISIINGFSFNSLKNSSIKRYEIASLLGTQTEGICFLENKIYFCCEKSKVNLASLFILKF